MRIIGNQELDLSEQLWRYFRTERFLELLQSSHLYFASGRQFGDPFEGAVGVLPPGFPVDPRYTELEFGEKAFEELRRLTKVSCWHRASYESDAMMGPTEGTVESSGSIVIKIAAEDKPLPSSVYIEAANAFQAATEIVLRYVHGWVLTKANPDLARKWKQDQDTKSGA